MFMKLEDGRVYCLPDGYEVEDRSLDPIRYVLNPTFAPEKAKPLPRLVLPLLLAAAYLLMRARSPLKRIMLPLKLDLMRLSAPAA